MRPIWFCLLLPLLLLSRLPASARQGPGYWDANYDSLRSTLSRPLPDTARLRTLTHLLDITELTDASRREKALPLLDELLRLNQRLRRLDDRPYRLLRRGVDQWVQGRDYAGALRHLQQAIEQFDRQRRPVPRLLIDLAPIYNQLHAEAARYHYFRQKLRQYQWSGAVENTAACYLVLAGSHRHRGDLNQAISCYLRAADLFRQFERTYYITEIMVTGSAYAEWGNLPKARQYLQQALQLVNRYHFQDMRRFYTLQALARVYLQEQDYRQALRYADEALAVARRDSLIRDLGRAYGLLLKSAVLIPQQPERAKPLLDSAQQLADALHLTVGGKRLGDFPLDATWAQYYTRQQDYAQAERHWLAAYDKLVAARLNLQQPRLLQQIIRFYDGRRQPAAVQRYTRRYLDLTDSLASAYNTFHVAQYESERAERAHAAQVARLRQQQAVQALRLRQRNGLLALALLTVAAVSGLGAVLYRQLRVNRQTLAELRKAQGQLVAAEKWAFVGEVSAGIAHELQNPLHFMKRFAEVSTTMLETMQQPPAADGRRADDLQQEILVGLRQNLQEISQHGLRASAIIRDMLTHSRSGTHHRQPTDLRALLTEQLRLAYDGLKTQDVGFHAALSLELEPELPLLGAVPQDLGRAVLNLLTNAFHAVRQRSRTAAPGYAPTVGLSARRVGDGQVEIRVRDNGTGMSPAVQARIFQPFFTTKAVGEGSGLGLSLAHDIITKGHGGSLRVQTQQGEFTEFIVTLPV